MDEKFKKILDDIESSTKSVKILSSNPSVKERMKEKYEINPDSLLGILLENTGGIIIDMTRAWHFTRFCGHRRKVRKAENAKLYLLVK